MMDTPVELNFLATPKAFESRPAVGLLFVFTIPYPIKTILEIIDKY
jgi:hypothetical protein